MDNNIDARRIIHNALIDQGATVVTYATQMKITVLGTEYVLTEA